MRHVLLMQVRRYFLPDGGRGAMRGSWRQLGREWWKALRVSSSHGVV